MSVGLITFLSQHVDLTDEEKQFIEEQVPVVAVDRDTILLKRGAVSKEFYFIEEGSVRLFYEVGHEEKTAFFYFEKMFVSSYKSFTQQIPAEHSLQTMEPTTLAVISAQVAAALLEKYPKFEFLARVMMEEELAVCQEIISSFVTLNAEQRYIQLQESNPDLIQRIPQFQLATFLGVTPETLSRIRKRIVSK